MKYIGYLWLFSWLPLQATDYYALEEYGSLLYKVLEQYASSDRSLGGENIKQYLSQARCLTIILDAQRKGFTESNVLKEAFSIAAKQNPQKVPILEGIQAKLLEHRKIKDIYQWSGFVHGCLSTLSIFALWGYISYTYRKFSNSPYINYSK